MNDYNTAASLVQSSPSEVDNRIARIHAGLQRMGEGLNNLENRLNKVCQHDAPVPNAVNTKDRAPVPSACCALDEGLMDIELRLASQLECISDLFRRIKV